MEGGGADTPASGEGGGHGWRPGEFKEANCGVWLGSAGCVTPLHYDLCHGVLERRARHRVCEQRRFTPPGVNRLPDRRARHQARDVLCAGRLPSALSAGQPARAITSEELVCGGFHWNGACSTRSGCEQVDLDLWRQGGEGAEGTAAGRAERAARASSAEATARSKNAEMQGSRTVWVGAPLLRRGDGVARDAFPRRRALHAALLLAPRRDGGGRCGTVAKRAR